MSHPWYRQNAALAALGATFLLGSLSGAAIMKAASPSTTVITPEEDDDSSDRTRRKKRGAKGLASAEGAHAPTPSPPPEPPPPEKTPSEKLLELTTYAEAIEFAKPLLGDSYNKLDPGMVAFGVWSLEHLTWKDIAVTKDETTIKSTMKDPDAARGKRMCVRGKIIQISVLKVASGSKGFEGLMWDNRRQLIKFIAAKSSGNLVDNSPARFCGVVTGKYTYSNSGGGTGHAVAVVGMFDLPENRL